MTTSINWTEENEDFPRKCLKLTTGKVSPPLNTYYEAVVRIYSLTEIDVRIISDYMEKSKEVFDEIGDAVFYALKALESLSKG